MSAARISLQGCGSAVRCDAKGIITQIAFEVAILVYFAEGRRNKLTKPSVSSVVTGNSPFCWRSSCFLTVNPFGPI